MNTPLPSNKRAVNKPKANQNKPTLDVQHNKQMQYIQSIHDKKKRFEQELFQIDCELERLQEARASIQDETELEQMISKSIELRDARLNILDSIKRLEDNGNEFQYYTHTADILFQYYDLIEKGGHDPAIHSVKQPKATENSILKYFNTGKKEVEVGAVAKPVITVASAGETDTPASRGGLLEQYMRYTDPEFLSSHNLGTQHIEEKCACCGSKSIVIVPNDGYSCCTTCNTIEHIIVDHDKPSYKDPPKEISCYAYKRINHLNEWISQIQGKETTEIPEEVYDKILLEIKKQRISNMADVTPKKVREILKKLKINKYYEHAAHIISRLNGNPIPQLSPELEEKLRSMFRQIQTPFVKHAPAKRKNFLSYSYCIHKFLQLLGEDELLCNFPLLKSRDKLHQQDQIWKKICEELGWEFYRSL